jgi:hypothetical protein
VRQQYFLLTKVPGLACTQAIAGCSDPVKWHTTQCKTLVQDSLRVLRSDPKSAERVKTECNEWYLYSHVQHTYHAWVCRTREYI